MKIKIRRTHIYIPALFSTLILIILAGGCLDTFDYDSYKLLYTGIYKSNALEPLFRFLQSSVYGVGISYDNFRLILLAGSLTVISIVAYKIIGKKILLFDFFYLFYSLPYDAINLRNTIANAIIFIGFFWYVKSDKHGIIKFVVCVIVAALFHIISMAYFIFIYAFLRIGKVSISGKRKRYYVIIFVIIMFTTILLSSATVLQSTANFIWSFLITLTGIADTKVGYFTVSGRYGFLLFSLCHIAFTITIAYVRTEFKNSICNIEKPDKSVLFTNKMIECVYLCNIILMIYLPLLRINTELYRIFRGMVAIEYICFFSGCKYILRGSKASLVAYTMIIFTVIINFYLQVLPYVDRIFITMFTENRYF